MKNDLTFSNLIDSIQQIHEKFTVQTSRAVNVSLTLRNWLIGFHIAEYEQNGADRAEYGTRLLDLLSARLSKTGVNGVAPRSLRLYRQFYLIYPQIWQTLSAKISNLSESVKSMVSQFSQPEKIIDELINKLSFSHIAELITIDDDIKRAFYEIECIRGNWSVRELKRQINSLYYE